MKTIALVEDNRDNRLLIRAIIEDRYALVEYATGTAALEGIRRNPPDVILLDISLPGMDGTEVLSRLRADRTLARIPAIALTAHAMRGDRERLLAVGFDAYVTKPIVDEEKLLAIIARCIASPPRRADRELGGPTAGGRDRPIRNGNRRSDVPGPS